MNLEILECDRNQLEEISGFNNLLELYCSSNKIEIIKNLNKLEVLHCYKNKIKNLEYMIGLRELLCDYDICLSKHYTIAESNDYKNNITLTYFK